MRTSERETEFKKELERLAARALRSPLLKNPKWKKTPSVEVFFLPNEELVRLKKQYYPRKNVTYVDVLSFPEAADFPNPEHIPHLGEIFLNRDFIRGDHERARFLVVHGLLHLLGYVHERKHDIIRMETMERELMAFLHLG